MEEGKKYQVFYIGRAVYKKIKIIYRLYSFAKLSHLGVIKKESAILVYNLEDVFPEELFNRDE